MEIVMYIILAILLIVAVVCIFRFLIPLLGKLIGIIIIIGIIVLIGVFLFSVLGLWAIPVIIILILLFGAGAK